MRVKYLQEGGAMAPEDSAMAGGAPQEAQAAPQQGGEQEAAMQQIYQMAQEIVQQFGPEVAAMLAQAIMEIIQGGGQEAPMPAPEEQPVYKLGGQLLKRGRH